MFISFLQIIDDEVDLEDDVEEEEEDDDDDEEEEEEEVEEFDNDEVEEVIWGSNNCSTSSSSTPKSSAASNTNINNNCSGRNDISDWTSTPIAESAAMAPSVTWPWDESTVVETPHKRPRLDNIHPKDKITHYFKVNVFLLLFTCY